jgi:hypothetical protein
LEEQKEMKLHHIPTSVRKWWYLDIEKAQISTRIENRAIEQQQRKAFSG